ncbi:MAG: UDP-N-acetylmuramate dehydrogenase [Ruminococcaceae bacterium]|nr:UDP-N-acetylmuramate dehydrogenase [Oscillospiraceae bacterium]
MADLTDFQREFTAFLPNIDFRYQEPMSAHTSFRIGGNAELMAFPKSAEELAKLLRTAKQFGISVRILGAGTNVLAPDEGIGGLVICLKDCMDGMERIDDTHIRVAAGVTMTRAAVYAANLGLSGLEFAHGIPGTVGGGVYMNAGAYGGEICQVCTEVDVMDGDGQIRTYSCAEMDFSYRHSILEDQGGIVVSAVFALDERDSDEIRGKMKELMAKRSASQPLDLPSAGSAFKRPVGGYAAALIDQAGLRGFAVGGAAISTKHAGFAVNLGGATAADVKALLSQVSDKVYEQFSIRLEPEVRIW